MSSFDTEVINFNVQWGVWKICHKKAAEEGEKEEYEAEAEIKTETETVTEIVTELSSCDMSLSTLSASKCA